MRDQRSNRRPVEIFRIGKRDAANLISAAFQEVIGIRQGSALQKEQRDPARIRGQRKQRFRGALRRRVAKYQGVVVVVNQFIAAREYRVNFFPSGQHRLRDFRRVFSDELAELALDAGIFHALHDVNLA